MPVQENIYAVEIAAAEVKAHCMCASFHDIGGVYRVLYPQGFQLDGVQAAYKDVGKRVALERISAAMERHWKESL